jgi:chromosome segregation ATPase
VNTQTEAVGLAITQKKEPLERSNALLLPSLLNLTSLSLAFLAPSQITPILPLFCAFSLFISWRYKGIGLSLSLLAQAFLFYFSTPEEGKIWHYGLNIAFSFSYMITFLTKLEVEKNLGLEKEEKEKGVQFLRSLRDEIEVNRETWERDKAALEEELKRWKEEAEARRIDKRQDERKFTLLQGDIEFYMSQKGELIRAAEEARNALNDKERYFQTAVKDLEEREQAILQTKMRFEREMEESGKKNTELKYEKEKLQTQVNHLEEALQQFSKVQNELLQGKESFSKEAEEYKKNNAELLQERNLLRSQIANVEKSFEQLARKEDELRSSSKMISEQNEAINTLKEELENSSPDEKTLRELNLVKANLSQLRAQFDEKTKTLSETRKELFQTQTKLMAFERESREGVYCPDLSEVHFLQKELNRLEMEKEGLLEEITLLEELISRIHRL